MSGTAFGLGGVDPAKLPPESLFLMLRREGEAAVVPPSWNWGTRVRTEVYVSWCYPLAFHWMELQYERARRQRTLCPIKGAQLVHGTVVSAERQARIGHAWVEPPGDRVFDGVTQALYTRASYYRLAAAQPLAKYSFTQARRLRKRHDHYGP